MASPHLYCHQILCRECGGRAEVGVVVAERPREHFTQYCVPVVHAQLGDGGKRLEVRCVCVQGEVSVCPMELQSKSVRT